MIVSPGCLKAIDNDDFNQTGFKQLMIVVVFTSENWSNYSETTFAFAYQISESLKSSLMARLDS